MILKYYKEKIYNPKALKNEVRRATQFTIDRTYKHTPLTSRALKLLLWNPIIRIALFAIIKLGNKITNTFECQKKLKCKGE